MAQYIRRSLEKGNSSELDKTINQIISFCRVVVENVIGSVKILRILKEKTRIIGDEKRQTVFIIGCALHNFRKKFRPNNQAFVIMSI